MSKDAKYFKSAGGKGEIHELKVQLNSLKDDVKADGLKRVIAAMTVGKDMSPLFTDVVKAMSTTNLETKKLTYLYIINHAKTHPDECILAVNCFLQDAASKNPLVRALAIRTMSLIQVDKITEYLSEPLRACLKDTDPYVRKTSTLSCLKLFHVNSDLVESQGFLDMLRDLVSDSNPTVVANAVAALCEIDSFSSRPVFRIDQHNLHKLLAALNECTEWGQVFILSALSDYSARDSREAEGICERVSPRLQHANSAVVLSAVRVLMRHMDRIDAPDFVRMITKKMAPPLVTLLSKEPEIQYVALRNINLIIQRRPSILQYEMKVFFCKYNDPIYVKMEKLEIMIMLASERNVDQVLLEFKEYAQEVDVEFVRKAVRSIGRCAIKLERSAERCIHVLLELIQSKVNYVVQEAIVVIKDIFRKYPNRYESIIGTLCENLEELDEPEAKASMIWIIGEYADRIENADELLDSFLESFADEPSEVQLQLLTATVKLFLKRPMETQELVQQVLNMATQESDNPDLRDRGFVYWRLLSSNPEAAKAIVLGDKPLISDDSSKLPPSLLDELISNISTLSSVYHKPPSTFVKKVAERKHYREDSDSDDDGEDMLGSAGETQTSAGAGVGSLLDLGGGSAGGNLVAEAASTPKHVVLQAQQGAGMQISGAFARRQGTVYYDMNFENFSQAPLSGFAIQFNKNSFGVCQGVQLNLPALNPGQKIDFPLLMSTQGPVSPPPASTAVQVAIKNNAGIHYFADNIPVHVLFSERGAVDKSRYLQMWKAIPDANEQSVQFMLGITNPDQLLQKFQANNVFFIARRQAGSQMILYLSLQVSDGAFYLAELTIDGSNAKLCVRSEDTQFESLVAEAIKGLC